MTNFFNSCEYLALESKRLRGRAISIPIFNGVSMQGILLTTPSNSHFDIVSVYGYPDFLVNEYLSPFNDIDRIVNHINLSVNKFSIISGFFRLNLDNQFTSYSLSQLNSKYELIGDIISVDLTKSSDEIISSYRPNLRNELKRAKPYSFELSKDYISFYNLYTENMNRVGAHKSYFFSLEYFRDFLNISGSQLVLGFDRAGPVAGAIFVSHGKNLYYHLGASSDRSIHDSPLKPLLSWFCLSNSQRGYEGLVLGGGLGGNRDSLFRFKSGFSKTIKTAYCLKIIFDEALFSDLSSTLLRAHDKFHGFFPPYRNV